MYLRMCKFNLFALVLVHCVYIFITGTEVKYFRSSFSVLEHAISDVVSLRDRGDKFLHDDWDIEPGCKCLNGKCEKLCTEERKGVCKKTGNECVCDAEFFKVNEETCLYCGCGKGFNCTFYHTTRTCNCPEGYYIRDNKCAAKCHESLPCQNGGTCKEGKCDCEEGTSGVFCESSDWCKKNCNKPLVSECVYNKKTRDNECLCKDRSLVYDFEERVCKPCPCENGSCESQNATLICKCNPGYSAINKQCLPCDCGRDGICEILNSGERQCHCKNGDLSREERCIPCDCGHNDSKCRMNKEGRKQCICPYGYEDILGKCVKMNKDDRRCLCHPTATCVETFDEINEFNCTCKEGYRGKVHDVPQVGEECIDIDECKDSKTCPDRQTTECVNFQGSFMCRCKTGHSPVDILADSRKINCRKYTVSWAPTGIVIAIIVICIVISVGALLFIKKRSSLFSSTPGIEMHNAAYKR